MVETAGPSGLPDLPPGQAWYTEPVRATLHHSLVLKRVIFSGATALQRVDILDTDPFGKTLVLDGKTQSAAADEFIYHEALVHPALVAHDAPADVFIAGGGEGATLREVLAHRTVRRAVMADLDGELVGLCREHLPEWHAGAFDDPRAELEIGDARAALERRGAEFDVIVIDVTDPTEAGPSLPLFTAEFYAMAARRLKPGGVLVTQAGPATLGMTKALTAIRHTVAQAFGRAAPTPPRSRRSAVRGVSSSPAARTPPPSTPPRLTAESPNAWNALCASTTARPTGASSPSPSGCANGSPPSATSSAPTRRSTSTSVRGGPRRVASVPALQVE